MTTLTRWVLAHRRLVVAFWLVLTLAGLATAGKATKALTHDFSLPGRESYVTNQAILHRYGNGGHVLPFALVARLPAGTTVDSPGVRARLAGAFDPRVAAARGARLVSYASTGDRAFVSADGRTTFALLYPPAARGSNDVGEATLGQVRRLLAAHPIPGATVHVTGLEALAQDTSKGTGPGVLTETLLGGIGALAVLAFVFASLLAFLPLVMAIVTIPTTFLLVWGLASVTNVSFIVQFLVALVGLGVAIDYSLLVVVRWREERAHGATNEAAIVQAMATAGRAVVFSGTTVAVGLLALVVLPLPFMRSVGYGGLLIPLVSVAVALTLLPVLLATVGPRLDWPRIRTEDRAGRAWTRWGQAVVRRRWLAAVAGLALVGALVVAAAGMHPGTPEAGSLAKAGDAHDGLVALERSGIGAGVLTPLEVLAPAEQAGPLAARLRAVPGVRTAVAPSGPSWRRGGTALVAVLPRPDGSSAAGRAVVGRVRDVAHAVPGARVGGEPAGNVDFTRAVFGSFPLMIALIAVITFLLLARAFRSVLLPLKAVLLNVASVAAAWGVMTLVWQEGWGSQLVWGIHATGAIEAWLPLLVFAFLYGLSMDYEVFILARMREEYDRTGQTDTAVVTGIGRTGRLVTSAALILFLAFVSMGSAPDTQIKILATGLGAGILLDATVIRALLVPAAVSLLGRWNWWMPDRLGRALRVPARSPAPVVGEGPA